MNTEEDCAFCSKEELEWRTIRSGKLFTSIVSSPWFREGQCLVIPKRHITTPGELNRNEGATIMSELSRLSKLLDAGFGTGIMQKHQPLQVENGIKVSHLHYHVFPRFKNETGLFPVPVPNSFDGFLTPTKSEVEAFAKKLR